MFDWIRNLLSAENDKDRDQELSVEEATILIGKYEALLEENRTQGKILCNENVLPDTKESIKKALVIALRSQKDNHGLIQGLTCAYESLANFVPNLQKDIKESELWFAGRTKKPLVFLSERSRQQFLREQSVIKLINQKRNDKKGLRTEVYSILRHIWPDSDYWFKTGNALLRSAVAKHMPDKGDVEEAELDTDKEIDTYIKNVLLTLVKNVKRSKIRQLLTYKEDLEEFMNTVEDQIELIEEEIQEKLEGLVREGVCDDDEENASGMENLKNHRRQAIDQGINKLVNEERYGRIFKAYDNAIYLNPNHADAYYMRAILYAEINDDREAVEDLKTATRLGHKTAQDIIRRIG